MNRDMENRNRFDNLDGLRAISCLCIIAMHIRANAKFYFHPVFDRIVESWTHFVPLFLMISGFGMFCGYYEKFRNGKMDLSSFYSRRYKKLLPFFITLILIDIVMTRELSHVIEGITESTLVFGLLPNNNLEVIGVSWTLGVIFLFYMLFPFVVFLFWTKRRAVFSFGMAILLSLFCGTYWFSDKFVIESFASRTNFLYSSPYIFGGCFVWMFRDKIIDFISRCRWIWLAICFGLTAGWYFVPNGGSAILMLKNLVLFLPWLMYAISVDSKILSNKAMSYVSGISLELYLAQMVIFRVVEKMHCLYLLGHGWVSFLLVWIMVIVGLIVFIEVWKRIRKGMKTRVFGR